MVKIDQLIRTEQVDDKRPDSEGTKRPDLRLVGAASDGGKADRKPKRRTLTAKQERFVAEVIKGATASDAYRAAYSAAGMKPSAIWSESSRLMGNPLVASRLQAARAA